MKFLYLIFFSLFVFAFSFAQSHYKPGYVVGMHNDTTRGFIDYRGWENNPRTFDFKQKLSDNEPQQYSINNASAFAITGIEYYQRYITLVSTGQVDVSKLDVRIDTNRKTDTAFFNIITSGKSVTLYNYIDKIKTHFFIKDSRNNQLTELDYFVYAEDTYKIHEIDNFRNQLQSIAAYYKPANEKLIKKIKLVRYKQNDIRDIIETINGGANQQLTQANLFGVRYFAGAAIRFNTLELGGGETFFPGGTTAKNIAPVISAGADFFFNKNTQTFFFRVEAGFTATHYTVPQTLVNGNETYASLDFKQNTFFVAPQIVYNVYSGNNLKIFADVGMLLNISSYNNYYFFHNFDNVSSTKQYGFPYLNHFWTSVPIKAGIQINKRVEIYAAYSIALPIADYVGASANISYFQAGLNYLF